MSVEDSQQNSRPLRIAILGSRGIPARYGGFETFAQEIATRLADRGAEVTVMCEAKAGGRPVRFGKVRLEYVAAPFGGPVSRIIYDLLGLWRAKRRFDVVYMLGYGSSFLCWIPRLFGTRVWVNMDGLEWRRSKWGPIARTWLKFMEGLACRTANRLIFDNQALAEHVAERRKKMPPSNVLAYGAPIIGKAPNPAKLRGLGLEPGRYLLAVCRFEPENSLLEMVRAAANRDGGAPLVIVSQTKESNPWQREVMSHAGPMVRFLGAVYDPQMLRTLRFHSLAYLHGHTVGGTNPSLLEAMGCGNLVLAHDNPFNREVLGGMGRYFESEEDFADKLWEVERMSERQRTMIGDGARDRVVNHYSWDQLTNGYLELLGEVAASSVPEAQAQARQISGS